MENSNCQRLWLISELYYPEMTSTGYYMTAIGEGLSNDFDVNVICGQPNYSSRGLKAAREEMRNGVHIVRAAGTRLNKNVIIFRIINMLTLGFSIFIKSLISLKSGDKVLVVTTPPSMPFISAFAALLKGASYTLLIHDNYPEMLIAVGRAFSGSIFTKSIDFANRWLYKHASKIIVVGRDMRQLLTRKTAGLDIPIAFIPNWSELESVSPQPRESNELLKILGLNEKLVLLYAGNFGRPNDIESIIEAASRLRDEIPVHFVFVGDGAKQKWLEQKVAELNLTNVSVLPPRPRKEQTTFLNACDIGIVSLVCGMVGVSMPSRTYNLLAAGKPILAVAEIGSEIELVVNEHRIGWVVPPGSPDRLADVIRTIFSSRSEFRELGVRARRSAETEYSLSVALDKYRLELR